LAAIAAREGSVYEAAEVGARRVIAAAS